jgi:hypothetical protein
MADNQTILKKLAFIESAAESLILECRQTRKLIEADVSTSTNTGFAESKIAQEARKNLRAKLLKKK